MRVRVHIAEPDEPELFERIVRGYLTEVETRQLRSEGFVEGAIETGELEGLVHCPAVRHVEHVKEGTSRWRWLSWFRR